MAVTTLKPQINVGNMSRGMNTLRTNVNKVNTNATNIRGILFKRTKVKRENISKNRFFQLKKDQIENRKNQEDILESSGIKGVAERSKNVIVKSTRGFLGRMLDFLGTLLVGWLVNNLPSIITMAKELIGRIQRMYQLMTDFFSTMRNIFYDFGGLLGAVFQNIISFDFLDTSRRVEKAMGNLEGNFGDLTQQFEEGMKLLTTSLGEGIVTGEDAAPFGSDYTTPPGEQQSSGPSGSAGNPGRLQPIHKQALDIIARNESRGSGDYNAMNNGKAGDRPGGSKKWLGKNLTDMTIGEVKYYQNNRKTLWAAGRYQIVPGSLPSAQKSAGLKDTDRFDQANQDLLAIGLLKSQGPGAWTPYSRYTKEEVSILYKAKDTPLGQPTSPTAPTPNNTTQIQPGKKYRGGENLTSTIGKSVSYVEITDAYGARGGTHKGLDIAAPNGTYIALKYDCEVVAAGWYGNYGNLIDVWVPALKVQLRMGHLSAIIIRSGKIPAGKSFARVGSTGKSSGPHIHLEYSTKKGSSNYGGSGDPSPYAVALILTSKPNNASFVSPSVSSTPSINPQVLQQPTSIPQASFTAPQVPNQTNIVPQRMGQQIVVIDDIQPSQPQMQMPVQQSSSPTIIPINPLNNLIKNKLFIDLAYT